MIRQQNSLVCLVPCSPSCLCPICSHFITWLVSQLLRVISRLTQRSLWHWWLWAHVFSPSQTWLIVSCMQHPSWPFSHDNKGQWVFWDCFEELHKLTAGAISFLRNSWSLLAHMGRHWMRSYPCTTPCCNWALWSTALFPFPSKMHWYFEGEKKKSPNFFPCQKEKWEFFNSQ